MIRNSKTNSVPSAYFVEDVASMMEKAIMEVCHAGV